MQQAKPGDVAQITGLRGRNDLNGKRVTLKRPLDEKEQRWESEWQCRWDTEQRWEVFVDATKEMPHVKVSNLLRTKHTASTPVPVPISSSRRVLRRQR